MGRDRSGRTRRLVRLEHEQIPVPCRAPLPLSFRSPPMSLRRIETGRLERRRDEGGRGGLAVGARDRDRFGDPRRARRSSLLALPDGRSRIDGGRPPRVVIADRAGYHDDVRRSEERRVVTDVDAHTEGTELRQVQPNPSRPTRRPRDRARRTTAARFAHPAPRCPRRWTERTPSIEGIGNVGIDPWGGVQKRHRPAEPLTLRRHPPSGRRGRQAVRPRPARRPPLRGLGHPRASRLRRPRARRRGERGRPR